MKSFCLQRLCSSSQLHVDCATDHNPARALCVGLQLVTSVNSLTTVKDMYITHTGTLHVSNAQTDRTAVVEFGDPGSRLLTSARTRRDKNVKVTGTGLADPGMAGSADVCHMLGAIHTR